MLTWFKTFLLPPAPLGAPRLFREYRQDALPLPRQMTAVPGERAQWRLPCRRSETIPLFEIENAGLEHCFITYRAEIRSQGLRHPACLELACYLPGRAPLVRRGWHHLISGDLDWECFEISQHLQTGQVPELIRLSLATEGPGTIWIRNVKVLVTPTM